jgi:hypothetical protein
VGHFLSFHGITRLVSSLWPFLAAAYLSWFASVQVRQRRMRARIGGTSQPGEPHGTEVSAPDRTHEVQVSG